MDRALGRGLHARRPARRLRRGLPGHRRAAARRAALRGRGTGARRASSSCELVAAGNPPALGDDVVVVGGGNTAMDCARTARAARCAQRHGPLPPHAARDALPDGGSRGRRSRRRGVEFLVAPGAARTRRRPPPAADLPAHGAGRAGCLRAGAAPVPVEGSEFTHRMLHRDRGHRPGGGPLAGRARRAATSPAGASPPTSGRWPRICPASSPAATRCWERTWRSAPWRRDESPRLRSTSSCRGEPVTGEARSAAVVFRPVDDAERAADLPRHRNGRARSHAGDPDRSAGWRVSTRSTTGLSDDGRRPRSAPLPDLRLPQIRHCCRVRYAGHRIRRRRRPLRRRAPALLAGPVPPGDRLRAGQVHPVRRLRADRGRRRRGAGPHRHRPRLRRRRGRALRPARCRKHCERSRAAAPRPAPPGRWRCAPPAPAISPAAAAAARRSES